MKTIPTLTLLLLLSIGVPTHAAETVSAEVPAPEQQEEGLTAQTLYEFLIGEIAGQRGDLVLASEAYADLARKTRDPRVVRRAAEIAIYNHDLAKAVDMSRLWVELEPDSAQANRLLISALIASGRLDEAKPRMESLLQAKGAVPAALLVQFRGLLDRSPDKAASLKLMQGLASKYPDLPEAHQVVAQSAIDAGQTDLALDELDAMLRLDPASELGALLKGEALSAKGDAAVLEFWQAFLSAHPEATRVRLAYAKALTRAGKFDAARQEFETLAKASPESAELYLAIGLLDMQMNDAVAAEQAFKRALQLNYPDDGLVKLYLGQISEAQQHYDQALGWYGQVTEGGHALQARLKASVVLAKLGRVDDAVAQLKQLEGAHPADRVRIIQTEAQLLREAKRYLDAYAVLTSALEKTPDEADLLYDRAMIEERLDRLPAMETDLRRLIKLQPDSAQAYNALGYTLVDRTQRIAEGIGLLEQALKLSPDDPFILDSMGWGQFRAGDLAKAEDYLRRAYKGRDDPEIAAHLGEVLWQKGDREAATQVWQGALKAHPDNELLRKTMARFGQ